MVGLLDSTAANLLGRISEAAGQPELWHIRSELRNLETTLSNLKAGIRDAEEKQKTDLGLYNVLKELKDAFSEADDLIEDLECEFLKWRVQNRRNDVGGKVRQFSSCFSSNLMLSSYKTADEINQITKRLDMIEETMSKFPLVEEENEHIKRLKGEMTLRTSITGSQVFARLLHLKKEAILSDNIDSIIGRDDAKQSIIDELVKHEDDKQQSPAILSIHGDGGMGKTALAKLVYNAHEVFDHFDKRMWLCVSEDFDVERLRKEVLSSATGEQVANTLTGHHLLIRLQRNLVGRKFLLVLDDFGALDPMRELELEEIVKMGANGSKIIITTRSEQILNDTTTHKIERLDEETSMVLFEHSFRNKKLTTNLTKIRSEVEILVPKCGGAPLAIKCLAGLLSSEASDGTEWPNVKDLSERWIQEEVDKDGCVSFALRQNYDLMPSYLKPCFLCFSLLPKDYVFYSFELIQLWMGQGILHSDSKNPEAVGEQYFNELWSRGLFEDVEEHALGYWFKIHSLVHDLAVQQANKEQKHLESLHQLSFDDSSNKDLPPTARDKIRCLSVPVGGVEPTIYGVPLVKCISKFRQLRFLYLCNSSLDEIPTSIDTLKHLRYLDLRGNRRLKRLPESICKLQTLQTLILAFCSELEELPKNIKNMISLRFLWITTKQASLGKDGIGSLTLLNFLAIGGSENLTHLFEDIEKLNSLQTLIIYDCKSLLTLPQGLKNLSRLCNMAIWGCEQLRFTFSLEFLRLKKLILRGFPALATLPKWINRLDEDLEILEVGEFPRLRVLPHWLPNLWELRILGISNCPRLENRMPTDMDYCDKLKELRITFCGSLSKRSMEESNHDKEDMDISHIPTIYVDSKKIKPRLAFTDEDDESEASSAPGGVGPTEEEKHGVDNANHVGVTNEGHAVAESIVGVKHGDSHGLIGIEQDRSSVDHNHVEAPQTGGRKHDGAPDDSHVGVGQTVGANNIDGATDGNHVGVGPTTGTKQQDVATNNSHVGVGQTVGTKQQDEPTDESHVGVKSTVGAKQQDGAIDDSHVGVEQTIGTKQQDGATDNSHVRVGPIVGAKQQDEATDDRNVGVGPTVGSKQQDGAIGDSHVGAGQNAGAKHDEAIDNRHVGVGRTIGAKYDGAIGDDHIGVGQIEWAKHDEPTNNDHVDVGKSKGAKLDGACHNDHAMISLCDDDHDGARQIMVTTFEGF